MRLAGAAAVVFAMTLLACAALDRFFGGQPGDPNVAPMHDLDTDHPMFAPRPQLEGGADG